MPDSVFGLLTALVLLSWFSQCPASETGREQEEQLRQVKDQIEGLKSELSTSELHRRGLLEELQVTELAIGTATRRLKDLSEQLNNKQEILQGLEHEYQRNERELMIQQRELGRQIRAAYAMGRQERLKILLNQQDPELVSRMLVYYDYFNQARYLRMGRIQEVVEELKQNAARLKLERQKLMDLSAAESMEQERLEESRKLRQQVLVALGQDISDKAQRLRELERDEQRLQGLVNRLQEELVLQPLDQADQQSFESLKGRLSWPTKGDLTAGFGQSKGGNVRWDGVMIAAPEGVEVKAVHRGRVAFADWLRGFGLLVIVDHGDGYMTLYGHNQSLFKETGEWVEAGEPLALVGNSGGRTESGVYFGIRAGGKPVNPKSWCQRTKGRKITGLPSEGTVYRQANARPGMTNARVRKPRPV